MRATSPEQEGDQHEILAGQAQDHRADDQREQGRGAGRGDEPDQEGQLHLHHQIDAGVGADAHEGGVAERNMPGADDQMQARRADRRETQPRADMQEELVLGEERPEPQHYGDGKDRPVSRSGLAGRAAR